MARPRTATNILEARGAFRANPARRRPAEPKPAGSFPSRPPPRLGADVRACWREIVSTAPAGVLTSADALFVELVATLLAEFRADPHGMPTSRLTRLSAEMHKLGLNPSGRASLTVERPVANAFDDV